MFEAPRVNLSLPMFYFQQQLYFYNFQQRETRREREFIHIIISLFSNFLSFYAKFKTPALLFMIHPLFLIY